VIIIRKNTKNLGASHELARELCFRLKGIPYAERYNCIEEAISIFEACRFYSYEELDRIAEEQLKRLRDRLLKILRLAEADSIIKALRYRKEEAIKHASTEPISQNSIPIMPVIGSKKLAINIQMQLLRNNEKSGQINGVPLDKIMSYSEEGANLYWLINIAPSPRCSNCYFLNIEETIAYAFYTEVFHIKSLSSRYKNKHHEPALCIILCNGRPTLCWVNKVPSSTDMIEPNAIYRLIH